jgi:hypothetical protein
MDNLTTQLTDIIIAIIQDKVDERIEMKLADLQEGLDTAASFDIEDHRTDILSMVEEDFDIDDKVDQVLNMKTFTVTVD